MRNAVSFPSIQRQVSVDSGHGCRSLVETREMADEIALSRVGREFAGSEDLSFLGRLGNACLCCR